MSSFKIFSEESSAPAPIVAPSSAASKDDRQRTVSPASVSLRHKEQATSSSTSRPQKEAAETASSNEFRIPDACLPEDGISSLKFAPNESSKDLLASSWDHCVYLYDIASRAQPLRTKYRHKRSVLSCTFGQDADTSFSGGLDGDIVMHDFISGRDDVVGAHEGAVSVVTNSAETGLVISGGWNKMVKLWDPRSSSPLVASTAQPGKVFCMDAFGSSIIVGTSGRHINVYDLRNLDAPRETRKSSLKYQTRCLKVFPDHEGFATGSIEGRVAIEYFPGAEKHKFSFKCHRIEDRIYPVNCIAMHPVYGTFASGGCDGIVNVWDAVKKSACRNFRGTTRA